METKKYLRQLLTIDKKIEDKLCEIKRYEDMAIGLGSPSLSKDKVQTSRKLDKMSTAMALLVDSKADYEKKLIQLTNLKNTITTQIDSMDGESYEVLSSKYKHGLTDDEIAWEKKCSKKTVKRHHDSAIKEFETLYGNTYLK